MTLWSQDPDGTRYIFKYLWYEWAVHAAFTIVIFLMSYSMDVVNRMLLGEHSEASIIVYTILECFVTSVLVADLIVDVFMKHPPIVLLVGAAGPFIIFFTYFAYMKIFGGLSQEEMHELKRAGDGGTKKKKKSYDTDEKQEKTPIGAQLRLVINKYIQHPDVWPVFEAYSSLLTFFAIVFYVYGTNITGAFRQENKRVYSEYCPWTYRGAIEDVNKIDMYLTPILISDYVLRFVVDKKFKGQSFVDFFMICDFLSISNLPVWLFGMPPSQVQSFGFLKFLRMLRVIHLKFVTSRMTKVQHQVLNVVMTIFSLFFCCAGLMLTLEYGLQDFVCWHDALYFSVASLTTVGYGDIGPTSIQGRLLCSIILISGVGLVSFQINEMSVVMQQANKYGGAYHGNDSAPHVILTGNFDSSSVKAFLQEFYHPNHALKKNEAKIRVLLMHPELPTPGIKILLEDDDEGFDLIEYLQGSPSNMRDLKRMGIKQAKAVFIMTNKSSCNPLEEDTASILTTLAVRKSNQNVKVFVQCLVKESVSHLKSAGANFVDCIPIMRSHLLANSFACPGSTAFIANLSRSCDYDGSIYADGCDWEIYQVPFAKYFHGLPFNRCVMIVFNNVTPRALLIGVQTKKGKVVINPGSHYVIQRGDIAIVMAVDMTNAQNTQGDSCEKAAVAASKKYQRQLESKKVVNIEKRNQLESIANFKKANEDMEEKQDSGNPQSSRQSHGMDFAMNHHSDVIPDDLKGHVIICGAANGLKDLVQEIRHNHSNVLISNGCSKKIPKHFHDPPIVVITPKPNKAVGQIRELPNMYTLFASASDYETLHRAHAPQASMVIILAARQKDQSIHTADGQSIKIALNLRAACKKYGNIAPFSVCELIDSKNTVYADPTGWGAGDGDYFPLAPVFAEGKIYTVDTQDTLLCQAYYNPSIYDTVEQMAKGTTALRQIEVPKDLIGKTFEDAFRRFSKSGEHIVVGLYTVEEDDFEDLDGDGIEDLPPPKGCKEKFLQYMGVSNDDDMVVARRSSVSMFSDRILPCVCTNPSTSTILKQGDRLLMLGHTDPQRRNPKQLLRAKSKQRLQYYEANENTDIEIQSFDAIESNFAKSSNKYVANQPRIRLGIL